MDDIDLTDLVDRVAKKIFEREHPTVSYDELPLQIKFALKHGALPFINTVVETIKEMKS